MADSRQLVLGIDVGGTKVLAGAVDEGGRVLGRGKVKSPFRGGPEEMTAALVAASDAALAEAGDGVIEGCITGPALYEGAFALSEALAAAKGGAPC